MTTGSKRVLCFAAALALPLSVFVPWILLHQGYPTSDASEYFWTAERAYSQGLRHGWGAGISSLYWDRHWLKPTLYPAFGTLGLLLTGGNVLWAIRLCGLSFFLLFLSYSFLSFELFLPAGASAIATSFVGLLPWVVSSGHFFNLELPILSTAVAAFYWLYRARNLAEKKATLGFGFFLGLGLCLRPADFGLFFFIPVLAWMGANWRRLASGVIQAFVLAVVMVGFWYGPFLKELWGWMFQTSYGEMAQGNSSSTVVGIHLFERFFFWLGGIPLAITAIAAIRRPRLLEKLLTKSLGLRASVVLSAMIVPLLIGASSHNISVRYYYPSAVALFALTLWLALCAQDRWSKARKALVGVTILFCWGWNISTLAVPGHVLPILPNNMQREFFLPYSPASRELMETTIQALAEKIPASPEVITIAPQMPLEFGPFLNNPDTLSTIAHEKGFDWEFKRAGVPDAASRVLLVALPRGQLGPMIPLLKQVYPAWEPMTDIALRGDGFEGTMIMMSKRER